MFTAILLLNAATLTAAEIDDHSHGHMPSPESGNTGSYSCNLREYLNQCRQYSIANDAEETVRELKEGCESMPDGKFQATICSTSGLSSRCVDIVRNYHKPDVIYDNYYYSGGEND